MHRLGLLYVYLTAMLLTVHWEASTSFFISGSNCRSRILLHSKSAFDSAPSPQSISHESRQQLLKISTTHKMLIIAIGSQYLDPIRASALTDNERSTASRSQQLANRLAASDSYYKFTPGITSSDVFYPSWLEGKWLVRSSGVSVDAPLGLIAFGGQQAMEAAQRDINSTIEYKSIFRTVNGQVLADRLYNVEQIVQTTMGAESIVNDAQLDGDLARRLRLLISPPAANGIVFEVALVTTDRLQETPSEDLFYVLEKSTQTIQRRGGNIDRPPMLKEIETITAYKRISDSMVEADQRTATFLSPLDPRFEAISNSQPRIAFTAVDVRKYHLTYDRIR